MDAIFYMWEKRREDLIATHEFYVTQGKPRITDQFSDEERLKKEADEYAERWLEEIGRHFDPYRHNPEDFLEQAYDEKIQFYQTLEELGNSARLALISGMFHLWERSLREWLTSNDGIGDIRMGAALPKAIWKSNFDQIFELLACAGLFVSSDKAKDTLDTFRLVVNTYKHGVGDSFERLKYKRPEFFDRHNLRSLSHWIYSVDYADYTDLFVFSEHIDELSEAIIAFWKAIPEYSTENRLTRFPQWFQRAHERDCRDAADSR